MSFSDELKINVNKLNADEALLPLLEITHPFIANPIRLVNDNKDLLSNGNNFTAMPFMIKRQDDIQGELPKCILTIPNIGRSLIRWIDSSNGGSDALIRVMIARRSSPDVIEETLDLGIDSVSVTTETINFTLVVQNNLIKRAVKLIYDPQRNPGLF